MSTEAINWAFKVSGIKSSMKFVLVALADNADADGMAWPSVASIVERTCLDRKTVLKALDCLEECGLLEDSGCRKGATRQIKIYRLCFEKLSTEESQNRNSSKNGTVPDFRGKSPNFPHKESQISVERVPNLGHGTIIEPSIEPSRNHQRGRATRLPADWQPSVQDVNYCRSRRPDLAVPDVAERFRNYWHAKSGRDATKLDWSATWRNWVLNERQQYRPHQQRSTYEQTMEVAQRAKAMIFGEDTHAEN